MPGTSGVMDQPSRQQSVVQGSLLGAAKPCGGAHHDQLGKLREGRQRKAFERRTDLSICRTLSQRTLADSADALATDCNQVFRGVAAFVQMNAITQAAKRGREVAAFPAGWLRHFQE